MTMKREAKDAMTDKVQIGFYRGAVVEKTGQRVYGKEAVAMIARNARYSNKPKSREMHVMERALRGPKIDRTVTRRG